MTALSERLGVEPTGFAIRSGEPSSAVTPNFASWMMAEQKRIFLLCFRMLRDQDEADMATQDTFLKAHQALKKEGSPAIEDRAKWLTRIAVNTTLDRLRSRTWKFWKRRSASEDEEIILRNQSAAQPTAEDRVFARQIQARLGGAIEKLSPRQKAVFTLRHFESMSIEAIADTLDLDEGTVKAHMARALAKLRTELKDLYGELA